MAEIHVSTAIEFLTSISSATINDTIVIDNDIDFNASEFKSLRNINAGTIDGKGHTLYNIQSNTGVFKMNVTNAKQTIKNLQIRNILHLGGVYNNEAFFECGAYRNESTAVVFDNCQIQGKVGLLFNHGWTTINQCYIEIIANASTFTSTTGNGSHFKECYINITKDMSSNNTQIISLGSLFEDCYFKGNIKNCKNNNRIFSTLINCVVNTYIESSSNVTVALTGGNDTLSVFNRDRLTFVTINDTTTVKGCTDAEMKNAQALRDKGFPIEV